ncbi:MAG: hypothetical protein R3F18_11270 [Lysobacterales bacterium]|nr:hypothetical protein [Xanthomonadales bacterium]
MRRLALAALGLALFAPLHAEPQAPVSRLGIAGIVTDPALGELSGLAVSRLAPDRFWGINDGGNGNRLVLIDGRGRVLRELLVTGAENVDWEDLASFAWKGEDWLLVADTGDNSGDRKQVSLWLLPEPDPNGKASQTSTARELRFTYPDAPHDVEAMTVDAHAGLIYLLSKRTVPPILFQLPLSGFDGAEPLVAERVATLDRIPQPTASEIERDGSLSRFRSQTTAMELDCTGLNFLVLTYDAIYRYSRSEHQGWAEAIADQEPARSSISLLPQAEAMALDQGCQHVYVGSEKAPVPLLRFRYRPAKPVQLTPVEH